MAAGKRRRKRTSYERSYVDGNTVRKLQPVPGRIPQGRPRKLSNTARKNRDRAAYMNMGYVMFLAAAIIAMGFICIQYLNLQADITAHQTNISKMESTLNDLKLANDEEYARILGAVDLEEIKRVAMDELGMKYASESQIITFSGDGSDYVRQYKDIPK